MSTQLFQGDCAEVLRGLAANSVDSIVTDPPYGLSFMGRQWDYDVPSVETWREVFRVLRPGGHLLAFAGTRTQHRMCVNIEDAGFEIRDMMGFLYETEEVFREFIATLLPEQLKLFARVMSVDAMYAWIYGSGFPKSKNLDGPWQGWGTALKPAMEPITVARKPLTCGTVAANALVYGTGAINIDGCRVVDGSETHNDSPEYVANNNNKVYGAGMGGGAWENTQGRWPANLIHDSSEEVLALFPDSNGAGGSVPNVKITGYGDGVVGTGKSEYLGGERTPVDSGKGSAARFFYCAKASKRDRNEGCEGMPVVASGGMSGRHDGSMGSIAYNNNNHPTVKPTELMRYLCRLITPPGGLILDPFMGSGSTGKAAAMEGFDFIGIELDPHYIEIARARIDHVTGAAYV